MRIPPRVLETTRKTPTIRARPRARPLALLVALALALPLFGVAAAQDGGAGGGGGGDGGVPAPPPGGNTTQPPPTEATPTEPPTESYPPGEPDLTVTIVDLTNSWNGDHQLIVEIRNLGASTAYGARLIVDVDGQRSYDGNFGPVGPGSAVSYQIFLSGIGYGDKTVRAEIDPDGSIAELDETNNVDERTFFLGFPDLAVHIDRLSPLSPVAGDHVWIDVTVANKGTAPARDFDLVFLEDGVQRTASEPFFLVLEPGQAFAWQFHWTAMQGVHTLTFIADASDRIPESNETNNQASIDLRVEGVTSRPDLVVSALWTEPAEPRPGENVRIRYQVLNVGGTDAPPSDVVLWLDGEPIAERSLGWIAPYAPLTLTAYWTATPGWHDLHAAADVYGTVQEDDEYNNHAWRLFVVSAPDLMFEGVRTSGTQSGEQYTLQATLRNEGPEDAPASTYQVYSDGLLVAESRIGPLASGLGVDVSVALPRTPGEHALRLVADAYAEVLEWDEGDNQYELSVDLGLPQLTVEAVVPDLSAVSYGEAVPLRAVIENVGTFPAHGSDLVITADGTPVHGERIRSIGEGQRLDITVWWRIMPGVQDLVFVVDPEDVVREGDESDNRRVVPVGLGFPGLRSVALDYEGTPEAGVPMTLSGGVYNAGMMGARSVLVSLDIDGRMTESWVLDMPAGATFDVSTTWTPQKDGLHTVALRIDPHDAVPEDTEDDNAVSHEIQVRKATPFACKAGEPVTDDLKETCRALLLRE